MAIHQRKQRGAVLLVVVSMLVLFVLIGVTYAIVSSQYRRGSRIVSRQKQLGVDPEQHLDSAFYQVLRDTRSPSSVVRGHSLLRDIYGTGLRGRSTAVPAVLDNGNFLRFTADAKVTAWSNQRNEYAGCVLTFTSGVLQGTTTRVLYSDNNTFTIMRPRDPRLPAAGTTFVVNGRAFSGFGAGHNAKGTPTPNAGQPNLFGNTAGASAYLASGAHENYDAVDYQNMALAAVIPGTNNPTVIPSFHRPALIRYWQSQDGMWDAALQRRVIMRPMNRVYGSDPATPGDHPNFTGSNPGFDPLNPTTWDVDNDNDGTPDSLWMDLGMPVQTDASGRKYKPLFALLCVDMDGKLNVNAHGSRSIANPTPQQQELVLAGNIPSRQLPPGQGFGPAEVSLRGLFANQNDYQALLAGRYGPGGLPGTSRGIDPLLQLKHSQYAYAPEIFRGNVAQGIDHYGQPIFENTGKFTDLPYELNLSQSHQRGKSLIPTVRDTPYSIAELERILRAHDSDQNALPSTTASNRLAGLLDPGTRKPRNQNNHLVTTDSYDLPVANGTALAAIRRELSARNLALPPALQMGLRWNINQPFGTKVPESLQRRQEYATYLYMLMTAAVRYDAQNATMKALPALWDTNGDNTPTALETAERIAQWAVNVVDFRDSDAIMTPFSYDPNPFDDAANTRLVWGCERPELLLTETVAFHDRRTEDLNTDQKTDDDNDADEDFDQRLQPRGTLFLELYNPWTGSNNKPQELYRGTAGVVLNATSPVGNSPTWRILISNGNLGGRDPADIPNNTSIERSVYFTRGIAVEDLPKGSGQRAYQAALAAQQILLPGRYAVAGSQGLPTPNNTYINPIGRHVDAIEDNPQAMVYEKTRHIQMFPSFAVNNNKAAGTSDQDPRNIQPVLSIPIKDLSISEPVAGYPSDPDADGWDPTAAAGEGAYTTPRDLPLDDEVLRKNTTLPNYRMVYLQRLANPLLPWNATTNPYRTIDQLGVDLTTFNGVTSKTPPALPAESWRFASHERGQFWKDNKKPSLNIWKQETIAWGKREDPNKDATHPYFKERLDNSLGILNEAYGQGYPVNKLGAPLGAPVPLGALNPPELTFPTLSWNNRSFVSAHELMLVPFSSQFQLLNEFTPSLNSNASYTPGNRGNFGHLPNFFDPSTGLYRIFDFVQTPSPFVRTETILHPDRLQPGNASDPRLYPPFDQISNFRDPGRINLNTIFDQRVWNGLWNQDHENELMVYSPFDIDPLDEKPDGNVERRLTATNTPWAQFVLSRQGYNATAIVDPRTGRFTGDPTRPSYFSNPFRSVSTPGVDSIESTIMRSNGAGAPLFRSIAPANAYQAHQEQQAHFRYQPLQRLSNLTTTRSNVYAIWATVGYFEVEHVGPGLPNIYPDGYRLGPELGWDRGEIRRHRAFYMVDRSIPVAFEPGENHNVDRAVLLKRFIE